MGNTNSYYNQGASSISVSFVNLGALGETYDLTSYEGYKDFTVGANIFIGDLTISSEISNTFVADSGDISGSANASKVLLSYNPSTGILTTANSFNTGIAQCSRYDSSAYNYDGAKASGTIRASGAVFLIY